MGNHMTSIIGIHQQYQGIVDRTTPSATLAEYPLTQATREFNANPISPQNLVPKVETACRAVWDEGLIAVWSVKPKPGDVENGKWKPYFQQLADYIKTSGLTDKFILVIWHEPENDIPKWFTSPEHFVKTFNTVHDWVKSKNPELLTSHAALGYQYGDKNMGTPDKPNWQPINIDDVTAKRWKTKADIHTIDLYQGRSWPLKQIMPENSAFKRWITHLVGGLAQPWGVSERGFIADPANATALGDRVDTILREARWLAGLAPEERPLVYLLWDTIGTEGDGSIPIQDDPGKEAVRYLMAAINSAPEPPVEEESPTEQLPTGETDCPLCHGSGTVKAGQTITIIKVVS